VLEEKLLSKTVQEDIQKLVNEVALVSQTIEGVRPPDPALEAKYKAQMEEFQQVRGRPLYWPFISDGVGRGPYVACRDGSVKLDLINGIGVHLLGHSHPKVIAGAIRGSLKDVVNQGHLQPGTDYLEMSQKLIALAKGSRLKYAWLSTCGTMANENALKMARQKNSPAKFVISMENAFSGRSTMMAEITDNPEYKQGLPSYNEVLRVPFFDKFNEKSAAESLQIMKNHIENHKGQIAAFCFEPMLGEGGYRSAPLEFWKPLFEECRKNNIAIWADEIQTFMRTGQAFAFQTLGFADYVDLVTIAKTAQVAATLYTEEYNPKPGLIAGTFAGATPALTAGIAVLDEMSQGGYFGEGGKIQKIHSKFISELQNLAKGSLKGLLDDPDGLGLMVAVTPFSGDKEKINPLIKVLFKNGLMTYNCGKKPMRVRFLLPAILTDKDIMAAMQIIEKSILEVSKG
jgi:acetylornithine/N-succinyldiaminopimelate aminotransferase